MNTRHIRTLALSVIASLVLLGCQADVKADTNEQHSTFDDNHAVRGNSSGTTVPASEEYGGLSKGSKR